MRRFVLALLVPLALPAAAAAARIDHLQVIATHNSYKGETSPAEQAELDRAAGIPGLYAKFYAYSHVPLRQQLDRQAVRGLELDLFPDPRGGRYATPLVRTRAGLGFLTDRAWQRPGIKVMHIADGDFATSCVTFKACLREIRAWSLAHRTHAPLPVLLELKGADANLVRQGGVAVPRWDDPERLASLDREIRSIFPRTGLLVPDDVRRGARTLERAVLDRGWPDVTGRVLFLLDNEPGAIRDLYRRGRPSLQGRVAFTNAVPGAADAAFLKRNDPTGANTAEIRRLVRRGYLVRTRADVPLDTVTRGSTAMLRAAIASGAQIISTDFPEAGMSARYGTSFVARLPGGTTSRCNPVATRCR